MDNLPTFVRHPFHVTSSLVNPPSCPRARSDSGRRPRRKMPVCACATHPPPVPLVPGVWWYQSCHHHTSHTSFLSTLLPVNPAVQRNVRRVQSWLIVCGSTTDDWRLYFLHTREHRGRTHKSRKPGHTCGGVAKTTMPAATLPPRRSARRARLPKRLAAPTEDRKEDRLPTRPPSSVDGDLCW
jgi:hypothetical protein